MDMSFMCKFLVQGRDAGRRLNQISANNVDTQTGMITYTQWLNAGGKLEADLTVTKLTDEKYFKGHLAYLKQIPAVTAGFVAFAATFRNERVVYAEGH